MICCVCGKHLLVNHGKPEWDGVYCEMCYEEVKNNSQFIIGSFKTGNAVGSGNIDPCQIVIGNCDHIYLTQKGIDLEIDVPRDKIDKFNKIIINGIKFVRAPD